MIKLCCSIQLKKHIGQKEGLESGVPMVEDARACLEAGARIVLLEAAELPSPEESEESVSPSSEGMEEAEPPTEAAAASASAAAVGGRLLLEQLAIIAYLFVDNGLHVCVVMTRGGKVCFPRDS